MIWNSFILEDQCQPVADDPFGSVDMGAPDATGIRFVSCDIEFQYFASSFLPGLIAAYRVKNPGIGQEMGTVIFGNLTIGRDPFEIADSFCRHYHVQNIAYRLNIHYSE
jgi:hypothetical protein